MRRLIVLLPLLAVVGLFFLTKLPKAEVLPVVVKIAPTATPTPQLFSEDRLWSLIQKWRTDNGFQAYIKDQRLCSIAQDRAPHVGNEIISRRPHAGLSTVIQSYFQNYPNKIYVAENIADDFAGEQDMLIRWLRSPEHLATLKTNYTYSCIACIETACSQVFSNF